MDFPRPIKIGIYVITFGILALGLAAKLDWYIMLFIGLAFYSLYRFIAMSCHHRYTVLPMIIVLTIISVFGWINLQSMSLLGIAMALDVII